MPEEVETISKELIRYMNPTEMRKSFESETIQSVVYKLYPVQLLSWFVYIPHRRSNELNTISSQNSDEEVRKKNEFKI